MSQWEVFLVVTFTSSEKGHRGIAPTVMKDTHPVGPFALLLPLFALIVKCFRSLASLWNHKVANAITWWHALLVGNWREEITQSLYHEHKLYEEKKRLARERCVSSVG